MSEAISRDGAGETYKVAMKRAKSITCDGFVTRDGASKRAKSMTRDRASEVYDSQWSERNP
jgi:hypothetical protein